MAVHYRNHDIERAVAENIRAEMARQNVSGKLLCQRVGIPQRALSERLMGTIKISIPDLYRIGRALSVPPASFLPVED